MGTFLDQEIALCRDILEWFRVNPECAKGEAKQTGRAAKLASLDQLSATLAERDAEVAKLRTTFLDNAVSPLLF